MEKTCRICKFNYDSSKSCVSFLRGVELGDIGEKCPEDMGGCKYWEGSIMETIFTVDELMNSTKAEIEQKFRDAGIDPEQPFLSLPSKDQIRITQEVK